MAKIDLITLSALTASDGSIIASGATLKFNSEFLAANTDIRITPRLFRNRELLEAGYDAVPIPEETIPNDFMLVLTDEEYYVLTPQALYTTVKDYLNALFGGEMFDILITP